MSQIIALTLFKSWGINGFLEHTASVSAFYKEKRDAFISCCEKYLKEVCEWTTPVAGMFVWIKLIGINDSFDLIRTKAVEKGVLLVPGIEFLPIRCECGYVRASYSMATTEQMETALIRLRDLLLEEKKA